MRLGFVGLGNMGYWMARNLQRAGIDLTVHDLDKERAVPLLEAGAAWAESAAETAVGAEAVLTSLPGPPQVEKVVLGENGLLENLSAGQTWIDLTTNSPDLVREIGRQAVANHVGVLESPVTGAVDGAEAGRLSLFVGGDETLFEKMAPVFAPLGQTFFTGPLGTGNVAKLVTNLLWFINAAAIGEGLALGVKAGIDPENLWAIIKSSAGNSWVAEHDVPSIFAGHYDPSFTLDLCVKDLELTLEAGQALGVPLELGAFVNEIFKRAQQKYGGSAAELLVVKSVEEAAEVSLQVPGYEERR